MDSLSVNPLVVRALEIAEKRLGSRELCKRLNAPEETIRVWRLGQATMPTPKFLELVDILSELRAGWNEWNP